jgi:uncharacterized Zn-binding protein involved in type VI secretion
MARALSGIGDLTTGEDVGCKLFPTPLLSGSPNVFVNGKAVATVGSTVLPHFCFIGNTLISHTNRVVTTGSPTVFVNGRAAACIGSLTDCGDTVAQGSPTVFVA